MRRAAVALGLVLAALLTATAVDARRSASPIEGTWQNGAFAVRISGSTGTVTGAGHFVLNTGTESLCRHQVGEQVFTGLSGSGNHYTGSFGLLKYNDAGSDACVADTPRAAVFDLVEAGLLRVCVASSTGTIDTSSTTLCRTLTRVGGSPPPATTTTEATRKSFLFLVSARADAVKMTGIPARRFYSTTDVQGAGKVDVDPRHGPDIVDGIGTVHVTHVYISDQFPDITMTLKVGAKGGVVKSTAGKDVIFVSVTVSASSVKACTNRTGSLQLSEGPPAALGVSVCGSSFLLVDGKGPKGADPTNEVTVKIE